MKLFLLSEIDLQHDDPDEALPDDDIFGFYPEFQKLANFLNEIGAVPTADRFNINTEKTTYGERSYQDKPEIVDRDGRQVEVAATPQFWAGRRPEKDGNAFIATNIIYSLPNSAVTGIGVYYNIQEPDSGWFVIGDQ